MSRTNLTDKMNVFFGGSHKDQILNVNNYDPGSYTVDGTKGNDFVRLLVPNGTDASKYTYTIKTGLGNDYVYTAGGNDKILTAEGNDIVISDRGNDTVHAGSGNDIVWSGWGNDFVDGYHGNDTIVGGGGHDTLQGGLGNDVLIGGTGRDVLSGGDGADLLVSQTYRYYSLGQGDVMTGGSGSDVFAFLFHTNASKFWIGGGSVIKDFQNSVDKIALSSGIANSMEDVKIIQTATKTDIYSKAVRGGEPLLTLEGNYIGLIEKSDFVFLGDSDSISVGNVGYAIDDITTDFGAIHGDMYYGGGASGS